MVHLFSANCFVSVAHPHAWKQDNAHDGDKRYLRRWKKVAPCKSVLLGRSMIWTPAICDHLKIVSTRFVASLCSPGAGATGTWCEEWDGMRPANQLLSFATPLTSQWLSSTFFKDSTCQALWNFAISDCARRHQLRCRAIRTRRRIGPWKHWPWQSDTARSTQITLEPVTARAKSWAMWPQMMTRRHLQ